MAKELSQLFVRLGMDDSDFKKSVNNIQKELVNVGKAMTGIGVGITAFMGLAVNEAMKADDASAKLGTQVANLGGDYSLLKGEVDDLTRSLARSTGIRVDTQKDALGDILMVTQDYAAALEILPVAMDLAATTGMELGAASTLVARAFNGDIGVLTRYGITLKAGTKGMEALAAIQERVGGSAAAMASPFDKLTATLSELMATIGTALLPLLNAIIDAVIPVIDAVANWIRENPALSNTIIIVVAAVGALMVVLGPLLMMLPAIAAGMTILLGPVGIVLAVIALLAAAAILVITYWEPIKDFFSDLWEGIVSAFKWYVNNYLGSVEMLVNGVISALNVLPNALNALAGLAGIDIAYPTISEVSIPRLAMGGIIRRPTFGLIGEAGPEAVIPLNKLGGASGGNVYNFNFPNYLGDKLDLIALVREGLINSGMSNVSAGIA